MMMGPVSTGHWIVLLVFLIIPALISIVTLRRAGWNGWWCVLWCVPLVNVIFLWVFAFAKWPNERKAAADESIGA
jgi:hypothetical protein